MLEPSYCNNDDDDDDDVNDDDDNDDDDDDDVTKYQSTSCFVHRDRDRGHGVSCLWIKDASLRKGQRTVGSCVTRYL